MPDPQNNHPAESSHLTAEDLALLLGDLSEDQRELVELLLKEQGIDLADSVIVPKKRSHLPGSQESYMPVSFSQQRMWFLDQFEPGSPYYNIPTAVRLTGSVNVEVLTKCLNEIVQRHESLRTTFSTLNNLPIQVIHPNLTLSIPVTNLENLDFSQRQVEAMHLANLEARQPFDLSKGPLLRVSLLRLAEHEHLFLLTMHHIISDGWSMGVFIHEMASRYEGYITGKPARLAELPIQYGDFSHWQREWLQGEILDKQLDYWLKQFSVPQNILELPTDHQRPAVLSSHGAAYSFSIPKTVTDSLRKLSQQNNATLFMTLLAAFQVLLYRYTGVEDLTVGTPIANRSRPELENLIGIFINTLALRTDLSGEPTFKELLARTREAALGAYAHQDVPFEVIVEKLQVERDLSHNPLFQVMLILQNAPQQTIRLSGMTLETLEVHSGTSTFDLTLTLTEIPDGLHASIEYNSDLFGQSTIERMFANWQMILKSVIKNADQKIGTIPVLTREEEQQILEVFNPGQVDPEPKKYVHQAIQAQTIANPDAIALVHNNQEVTYIELRERVLALGVKLRQIGVNQGSLVGLCLPRSIDLVAAMLATLEIGGAFLPLDPNYPWQRLQTMLADSQASTVISLQSLLNEKPELVGVFTGRSITLVCLDVDMEAQNLAGFDNSGLQSAAPIESIDILPDDLAYVIYTSGSTGRPKGVQISHKAVANFVAWAVGAYGIHSSDRVLQFASVSFDTAVEEIFPTLLSGAALILRPDPLMSFHDFQDWIATQKLTVLDLPTAYWHAWVSDLERNEQKLPECIRIVIVGGERALPEQYSTWLKIAPRSIRWINTYGPTESTVVCLAYEPPLDWQENVAPLLPVGRPITNMQVLVVDANQQLVPIGVRGELWVAGDDLALGYLNQSEMTAEKFISPPHWESEKTRDGYDVKMPTRYYRTGDQVRFLPDGNLDFLGRVDEQIKLRGFRIELGEIETTLVEHPAVREAAVIAVEVGDSSGGGHVEKLLAAFITLVHESALIDITELQAFVKAKLPEYMVPAVYEVLPELPLTPSGKIDRKVLAAIPIDTIGINRVDGLGLGDASYVAPRTSMEEKLAELWAQLLGVRQVGIHANFFELGGHSLLATQFISRLREELAVDMPLRELFESPTVAGFAEKIEAAEKNSQVETESGPRLQTVWVTNPIRSVERDPINGLPLHPAQLSFAQQRLWFLEQFEPGTPGYLIPSAIRLKGKLNIAALEASLNEIVRRHETLRTSIITIDGRPAQIVQPPELFAIAQEDLRYLPEATREQAALEIATQELRNPFDLTKAPLFRARLLKLADEEHLALLSMHHIISDGWSTTVLIRELTLFYHSYIERGEVNRENLLQAADGLANLQGLDALPALPIQYVDFAEWQRDWLRGEVLQSQIDYWKATLTGALPLLELPTDRPRPAVQTMRGSLVTFELGPSISQAVEKFCQGADVTQFMFLLAVFQVLLSRYSGQTDICVGTPIANRNRVEIEPLIGFFVNTLVLRSNLSENPSFRDLLKRVRESALGAFANQDVPFETLVNELQLVRDTSYSPLFQVMFVLQNLPTSSIQLPDLTLSALDFSMGVAKFDLTLTMEFGENGLAGAFEYNTDLYEEGTIERMVRHYRVLLDGILAEPERGIEELDLISEAEKRELLVDWNQTNEAEGERDWHGKAPNIVDLYREQVKRTPEETAVTYRDTRLSYAELDERSEQLGKYLREAGVEQEEIVGLCMERSLEMVVGILGILKAGGAYLPLDPEYPRERLSYILGDARVRVLLTQGKLEAELEEIAGTELGVRLICVDQMGEKASGREELSGSELVMTKGESLAYVIYTSGSTGKPKGMMIEHRSAINLWRGLERAIYATLPGSNQGRKQLRVSLNAPLPFDASVQEWLMLLSGHTLVVIPGEERQDGERLLKYIREEQVEVVDCVPSQLKMLIGAGMLADGGWTPRAILPGGEAIDGKTWEEMAECEGIEFYNMYGPTECTVDSTICQVSKHPKQASIGRPIVNVQAYVLDGRQKPAPIGVAGELYLGGRGVGRGYLNREELTAERFIANPFAGYQGENGLEVGEGDRLYKTGDLVRYLADGNLEYLGRMDTQVKLRGFRIELGEIESELMQAPGIREAVVVVREDEPGEKQLTAYVVMEGEVLNVSELRNRLKSRLPEYMVPGIYVRLEALPLTPNRKVDRKGLPKPEGMRPELGAEYQEPRTEAERILVEIWKQVLKLDRVGVRDNFFDLGGDSILSIQVVSRANQMGLKLTPRQIFEAQSIAELAALAGTGIAVEAEQGLVIGSLPLTPIEYWFFDLALPNPSYFNQALMLEVDQRLDPHTLKLALIELIKHHDALRLRFKSDEGVQSRSNWQQTIVGMEEFTPDNDLADKTSNFFEYVDLSELKREEQTIIIERYSGQIQAGLNINHGPLFRMVYFEPGSGQKGRILIVIHHLAIDGVSWRILLEDLQSSYLQLVEILKTENLELIENEVKLPPKTTSYLSWARMLSDYAQDEKVLSELDYWVQITEKSSDPIVLDDPDGKNVEASGHDVRRTLDEEETRVLLQEVPAAYKTEINDILLAALVMAYRDWLSRKGSWPQISGEISMLLALEGHGREELIPEMDLTRTVGWFTSIYPVRLTIKDFDSPGEIIKKVKEQLRAIPNRGVGYGLLRYLNPESSLVLSPMNKPQLSFNYLGQFDRPGQVDQMSSSEQQSSTGPGLFGIATESTGSPHDPTAERAYLLEVNGGIAAGRLGLEWSYSSEQFNLESIELFADQYLKSLRELIAHCLSPEAGGFTTSDFPLAGLEQTTLDKVISKVALKKRVAKNE